MMRYYRITSEHHLYDTYWGGSPTYWFEINHLGDARRQVVSYPNGYTLRYDEAHAADEFDGLHQMVVDGDEDWWLPYRITHADFEHIWSTHMPMNQHADFRHQLVVPQQSAAPDSEELPF
jgi:hypothetical protein